MQMLNTIMLVLLELLATVVKESNVTLPAQWPVKLVIELLLLITIVKKELETSLVNKDIFAMLWLEDFTNV
jgi:hypothetical protein